MIIIRIQFSLTSSNHGTTPTKEEPKTTERSWDANLGIMYEREYLHQQHKGKTGTIKASSVEAEIVDAQSVEA
jgi:hypothetical protein